MKEAADNTDAKYEIVELHQKIEEFENQVTKLHNVISDRERYIVEKEHIISDCNIYIESISEQLAEKSEELENVQDKIQNNSTINAKDEEIASLQAELALLHDNQDKVETLEADIERYKTEAEALENKSSEQTARINQLETDLVAEHEQFTQLSDNVQEYNIQVTSLKAELVKRNEEILEFVKVSLVILVKIFRSQQVCINVPTNLH